MLSLKNNARQLLRVTKKLRGNETGVTLLETLVALALLSIIAVVFLGGLTTVATATLIADEQATAESLARSQMEYVKRYPYDSEATTYPYVYTYDETYNPNPITLPESYTISVEVSPVPGTTDSDIQKITVTVNRNDNPVLTLEGYKVAR